ncbi:DUF4190 domain-containing protein [Nocardioides sp. R1-1]|uniref:DUF4190 domain-containing protein n=1 Tax=Nocardioides sp. R1-1 TaxID=3383502 RepID=UPI0038D223DB
MSDTSYPPPPPSGPGPGAGPPFARPPGNGVAIAALVLGIVALAVAVVPLVNLLGIVLALVGVGLGVAGMVRGRRTGRGTAMAGCGIGLSVLAIAVSAVVAFWTLRYLGDLLDIVDPPEPTAEVGEWFTTDGGDLAVRVTSLSCAPAEADPGGRADECVFTFEARNESDDPISLNDVTVKSVLDGDWGSVDLRDPADGAVSYSSIVLQPGDEKTVDGDVWRGSRRLDGLVFDANDASSHSAVVVDAGSVS